MLAKFTVKNFKNFEGRFTIDLTQTKQYAFSEACVRNGIVKTGLIYGPNGIGKSNLGKAIFDIVQTVTDKTKYPPLYVSYVNARHPDELVEFDYEFMIEGTRVRYKYDKRNCEEIQNEMFFVGDKIVVDRHGTAFNTILQGATTLAQNQLDGKMPVMRFIRRNALLVKDEINKIVSLFFDYVDRMLMFWTLMDNCYQGFMIGSPRVDIEIIKSGRLAEFEAFLKGADVDCALKSIEINGEPKLFFDFGGDDLIEFWANASTGTRALLHFFFWYMQMQDSESYRPSFLYLDEFNAFFHEKTAAMIVEKLRETQCQVLLTTHDSNLLKNDLLRPDCAFNMLPEYKLVDGYVLGPLSSRTQKELRLAHNIPKMFRAGAFG